MLALWFYFAGSLCFLIGTVVSISNYEKEEEEEEEEASRPWGFVVQDSGTVDGGEPDWEGWDE